MMFSKLHSVRLQALTIVCTIASMAGTSLAQDPEFNEDLDKELEGVTIVEHLDVKARLGLAVHTQKAVPESRAMMQADDRRGICCTAFGAATLLRTHRLK